MKKTSVIARGIDAFDPVNAEDPTVRGAVIDKLMHYFDTDAVCYHEEFPEILTDLQTKYWNPIIEWAEKTYNVKINTTTDIFAITQPEETKAKFRAVIEKMDPLELAAFEKGVMSSKSFLIGFALVNNGISVENAANAAQVEMMAQMDRWGEVEDSKYLKSNLYNVKYATLIGLP